MQKAKKSNITSYNVGMCIFRHSLEFWLNEWVIQGSSPSSGSWSPTSTVLDDTCTFVMEIRKKNGKPYPPETLYHIVCGILRFVRSNGKPEIDFFNDKGFAEFKTVLDAEMKKLKAAGICTPRRKSEPLSAKDEELLWEKGILGDHTPQALLNAVFYLNGINFALRSGDEHRQLNFKDCQIKVMEIPNERPYLHYIETVSKNNQGGLKGRRNSVKEVKQHSNESNPSRCPVRLFKLYNNLCPKNRPEGAFYLQPLRNTTSDCWFSVKAMGHCALDGMVKKMCESAGIEGFQTNHSLRASTATRLYQAGVDEQLIMERTGHRSIDGVRSYKRTSDEQRIVLSDIINNSSSVPAAKRQHAEITCSQQQVGLSPSSLSIQNCSNFTLNIN